MKTLIKKNQAAVALVLAAVAFLLFGVWRGEAAVVLRKAVNICMECIGLG